ncbi:MAG: hypothetical protein LCH88_05185 [Proteobacteria bacterium]|nr:hypothetical protein [Pseudomonadota bacterium]
MLLPEDRRDSIEDASQVIALSFGRHARQGHRRMVVFQVKRLAARRIKMRHNRETEAMNDPAGSAFAPMP